MNYSLALHEAIAVNDEAEFHRLLQNPGIDLNLQNAMECTPLMECLKNGRSTMAKVLLEAGCDVTNNSNLGALCHAMAQTISADVLKLLIQRGADINLYDKSHFLNPLQIGIVNNNLEKVSMLLYYGADDNSNGMTLKWAIIHNRLDIGKLLIEHYNCSVKKNNDCTALCLAVQNKSDFAFYLVKAGADMNCVTGCGNCPLRFSLQYTDGKLFKLIWPKFNYERLDLFGPFLMYYIEKCVFSNPDWLECLYTILKCPVAFKLIDHCERRAIQSINDSFMYKLLKCILDRGLAVEDRVTLITTCLSLGATVTIFELVLAYIEFGHGDEFEMLIYLGNVNFDQLCKTITFNLFRNYLSLYNKSYCSISSYPLRKFLSTSVVCRRFNRNYRVAPLVELSCKKFREVVKDKYNIEKVYELYDIMKYLEVPVDLKAFIFFGIG